MTGDKVPGRSVVLIPGGSSNTDIPLLMYAGLAATRRGAHIHRIAWNAPVDWDARYSFVATRVAKALDEAAAASGVTAPVLISKSLGTLAAPLAADQALPAVWFTPLLTDGPTVAALRRATAPCLIVGGTADSWWDGSVAKSITSHVVEVAGAGHAMFVPGPVSASTAVLGRVMDAVESFLDEVVWPDDRFDQVDD
jgi:pimeloyl-ACP methyl ester carboxylesterase